MGEWLLEQGVKDPALVSDLPSRVRGQGVRGQEGVLDQNLAVFLRPLVVLDTKKWFGQADLRLDTLVVHGGATEVADLYHPKTIRFPGVADGDDLAGSENGILVYYGKPAHFISLSVMLSRDTRDTDDLAALFRAQTQSEELREPLAGLANVLPTSPEVAVLRAGLGAALVLGDLAYKLIRQASSRCLGIYRAAWLANRDRFGIGRHPSSGYQEIRDFRIGYEIAPDEG